MQKIQASDLQVTFINNHAESPTLGAGKSVDSAVQSTSALTEDPGSVPTTDSVDTKPPVTGALGDLTSLSDLHGRRSGEHIYMKLKGSYM